VPDGSRAPNGKTGTEGFCLSSMPASWEGWMRSAARRLAVARNLDFGAAALDVRVLLRHVLGLDAAGLILRERERPAPAALARAEAVLARRLAGEPVSRIMGEREFWGRSFIVTPSVLDPRADTEVLVEAALETVDLLAATGRPLSALKAVDVGTGSGIMAVSLLAERPSLRMLATDISDGALAVAMRNACRHGVADRLRLLRRPWLEGVPGPLDLIVSNPPYIPHHHIATLAPEVARFDPRLALDGGMDGLAAYRALAGHVCRGALSPGGFLLVECGHDQAEAVTALFCQAGLAPHPALPSPRRDLAGRERVIILQKR